MLSKKKTSLILDSELMKQLKIASAKLDTTQTELMEKYIKAGLENEKMLNI